jgi:guanyl-specific ribonuclease Sa
VAAALLSWLTKSAPEGQTAAREPSSRVVQPSQRPSVERGERVDRAELDDRAKKADRVEPRAPTTRLRSVIEGVRVVDQRTGTVHEGPIDLSRTLERIAAGEHYPHRNDGGVFQNRPLPGQREPELPRKPSGYYREYVHPTPGIDGPGPQRVVVGQGGEYYYTPDHYQTFIALQ